MPTSNLITACVASLHAGAAGSSRLVRVEGPAYRAKLLTGLAVQVTSFLSAGEEDGAFTSWQGKLGLVSEKLRNSFLQLADPPLDLPGTQVGLGFRV